MAQTSESLSDQENQRCPFLTQATGTNYQCVKVERNGGKSRGVCTISSTTGGARKDWLACPFRALDTSMLRDAANRLFSYDADQVFTLTPATLLGKDEEVQKLRDRVAADEPSLVYFQNAFGGEIKLSATDRSPAFSFDSTMVEILRGPDGGLTVGKYGIFEIQTADFHGTYETAVNNISQNLRMFPDEFKEQIDAHQYLLSEDVESPNTANIFKRTFYQMMFKFQVGAHDTSAGCIFAVPRAVWDSWQKHLGAPELVEASDGTWRLSKPDADVSTTPRSWIYVFDIDASSTHTPNKLDLWRVIGTDAPTLSYFALEVAPEAALEAGGSVDRLREKITQRLGEFLPDFKPSPRSRARKKTSASRNK
ncbi:hypothetical protein OHB35_25430 [Streptomyces phaeochromogenes]|uniref:Restriction endonuclease type II NotI domain-containing protein n=1 Tax=Streptomyces phaeochromogenes TaxID=1923 RepID=A0ABZ1HGJ6_STRPH|nr:hypothetical protein [Streptomyces phaeochromogenes]WSD16313.1 hypothetical protein OHB35_25430 [Streptomyces phaeochromogenes]